MAEKLTIKQKKEWAKTVYLHEHITQVELAQKVGVTQKTISKWVNEGNWEIYKSSLSITREEQVANLYQQLSAIHKNIAAREEKDRAPTSQEADAISKIGNAINKIDKDSNGLPQTLSVFKSFLGWVHKTNPEKAKELSYLFETYTKELVKWQK